MNPNDLDYIKFLREIREDFEDFIILAKRGRGVMLSGSKARKASMNIREKMKKFRKISLKNEKDLKDRIKKFKKSLQDRLKEEE